MIIALLLACSGPDDSTPDTDVPVETDVDTDSSDDTDPGDTDPHDTGERDEPTAWPVPEAWQDGFLPWPDPVDCATTPLDWPMNDAADIRDMRRTAWLGTPLRDAFDDVGDHASDVCPTYYGGAHGHEYFTEFSPCSVGDEMTFEGRMQNFDGRPYANFTYERPDVVFASFYSKVWFADGYYADFPEDIVNHEQIYVAATAPEVLPHTRHGQWRHDLRGRMTSPEEWTYAGSFEVFSDDRDGTLGTFCIEESIREVSDCPSEGVGTIDLHGATDAQIVLDGDVTCDGCGWLTIGGGTPEVYCP